VLSSIRVACVLLIVCFFVLVFFFVFFFFFFQAEDGIRDATVTGVQTCALPIFAVVPNELAGKLVRHDGKRKLALDTIRIACANEIGRASCRERVEISGVAASVKKKKEKSETT